MAEPHEDPRAPRPPPLAEPPVRHPLVELTIVRLKEFVREPEVMFWVFGFPVLLAVGLGIAFRAQPPEKSVVGVLSGLAAPRALEILRAAPDLEVKELSASDAELALKKGRIDLLLSVDTSSSASLLGRVHYRFDPAYPKSAPAKLRADAALEAGFGRRDVLSSSEDHSSKTGARYIDFLIPGLLGLNLMSSSMWGIGYAVVDARARKLMKRFRATPMKPAYYLLSFILSRFFLLFCEMVALLLFARLTFDVQVEGNYLDVAIIATLGAGSYAGLALLIAARPSKPEVASGWMNFVMMPMWLLSGALFSYERFPEVIHPVIRALPLTAMIDALRAVMNDGHGLGGLGHELLVLLLWGVISFALALRLFRWQ